MDCAAVIAAATGRFADRGVDEADVKKKKCALGAMRRRCEQRLQAQVSVATEKWRGWRQPRGGSIGQRSALRKFRAQSSLQAATNPRLWQPPLTLYDFDRMT